MVSSEVFQHSFVLSLICRTAPELYETHFTHPLLKEERYVVRGKLSGAFAGAGSFQWTRGVRALCVLAVRSTAHLASKSTAASPLRPLLAGNRGSLAASLDYALEKEPLWLADMFGVDAQGTLLAHRLIHRSNPGRRRPGVVALSLNPAFLPPQSIHICLDGIELRRTRALIELEEALINGDIVKYQENIAQPEMSLQPRIFPQEDSVSRLINGSGIRVLSGNLGRRIFRAR